MPKTEAYNDFAPLNNLYLLADIAMAHTQLSDSNSSENDERDSKRAEEQESNKNIARIKPISSLREMKPFPSSRIVIQFYPIKPFKTMTYCSGV